MHQRWPPLFDRAPSESARGRAFELGDVEIVDEAERRAKFFDVIDAVLLTFGMAARGVPGRVKEDL
jgi:hypothetical protein